MILLFSLFLITLFFSNQVFACSFNEFVPFNFNPNEYVFFGKAIGYSSKVEATIDIYGKRWSFEAYGVQVKVENTINMPRNVEIIEVFKIFPCNPAGQTLSEVMKEIPVGTNVRVIGQTDEQLFGKSDDSIPKIEVSGGNQGQLFNNQSRKGDSLTSTDSVFDYRQSLGLYDTKFPLAKTFVWLFELRKDLKRLKEAKSENEKYLILKRLAYAYDNYQDYGELLKANLSDKQKQKELLRLKKNWERKKFS